MTLIVGFVYKNSVFLAADSAETSLIEVENKNHAAYPSSTSFGETIENNQNYITRESSQKLYSLSNKIILGFSGSTFSGNKIIEDLKIRILSEEKSIIDLISDYFKEVKPLNNSFIFGFVQNNLTYLGLFKNKTLKFTPNQGVAIIGSATDNDFLVRGIHNGFSYLNQINVSERLFQIFAAATIESLIINLTTLKTGIGGFVSCVQLSSSNITWMKDQTKILYSSKRFNGTEKNVINQFMREEVLLLTSPFIPTSIYYNQVNGQSENIITWENKWLSELLDLSYNMQTDYCAFLSYDNLRVIVLEKEINLAKKILKTRRNEQSKKLELGFSNELEYYLTNNSENKNLHYKLIS